MGEHVSNTDLAKITHDDVLTAVQDEKVGPGFRRFIEEMLEDSATNIREQVIAALVGLESESSPDLPGQAARAGRIATVRAVIAAYVEIIARPDVLSIEVSRILRPYDAAEDGSLQEQLTMDDLGTLETL